MGLQNTNIIDIARVDFHRNDFEKLIAQKGREVIKEQGILCPCKSKASNQQSNCKNCGGSGFLFINPVKTRLVLQGMEITPNYKSWSEEIIGDLKVTGSDTEELSFMDRITMLDGRAIFNEVIFFKTKDTVRFSFTAYDIKEILYIAYFEGVENKLRKLALNVDYVFEKNIIRLTNPLLIPVQDFISVTVRYVHAPAYLMIDMKRESMESFELLDRERLIHLPISGTARRAHYILTAPNLNGDRLLDNNIPTETHNRIFGTMFNINFD